MTLQSSTHPSEIAPADPAMAFLPDHDPVFAPSPGAEPSGAKPSRLRAHTRAGRRRGCLPRPARGAFALPAHTLLAQSGIDENSVSWAFPEQAEARFPAHAREGAVVKIRPDPLSSFERHPILPKGFCPGMTPSLEPQKKSRLQRLRS